MVHEHGSICSIAKRFVKGLILRHVPAPMIEPQPQLKPEPASKDKAMQLTRPSEACQLQSLLAGTVIGAGVIPCQISAVPAP